MFACLVPGFPPRQPSPYKSERKSNGKNSRTTPKASCDDIDKSFYDTQLTETIFHDGNSNHGPISQVDGGPILPPQSGEKPLDNETVQFLEALLEFMVTQVMI